VRAHTWTEGRLGPARGPGAGGGGFADRSESWARKKALEGEGPDRSDTTRVGPEAAGGS